MYTIWRASQTSFLTSLDIARRSFCVPRQTSFLTSRVVPLQGTRVNPPFPSWCRCPRVKLPRIRHAIAAARLPSYGSGQAAVSAKARTTPLGVQHGIAAVATRESSLTAASALRGPPPLRGATRHYCRGNAGARAQPRRPRQRTILTRTRRGSRKALPRRRKLPVQGNLRLIDIFPFFEKYRLNPTVLEGGKPSPPRGGGPGQHVLK